MPPGTDCNKNNRGTKTGALINVCYINETPICMLLDGNDPSGHNSGKCDVTYKSNTISGTSVVTDNGGIKCLFNQSDNSKFPEYKSISITNELTNKCVLIGTQKYVSGGPPSTCNVCDKCCVSYIPNGKECDDCVNQNCSTIPTPIPPTPAPPTPIPPTPAPPTPIML